MSEPEIQEVRLFGGRKGPYGDAVLNDRRPGSYKGTMHMTLEEGQATPFYVGTETLFLPQPAPNWTRPIEWTDSDGHPIVLLFGARPDGTTVGRIEPNGDLVNEFFSILTKNMREGAGDLVAALHSDGSTLPYIFAAFGTDGAIEYRTQAGVWDVVTGTPTEGHGLFSENGNLWVILTNGYQVRNWPAGTNPVTGIAGGAIDVGNSSFSITGAGLLGRRYLVFVKPDGIYVYDSDTTRFENIWAGLSQNPHPETGKGTYTWGSNVYIPLGWGGMVEVTRDLNIRPVSLLPTDASPDLGVSGRAFVRGIAGDASALYVTVEPFQKRLGSEINLSVQTTADDISFNDRTAVSTDDDPSTNFTLADLVTFSFDSAIYVGASVRFHSPWFLINQVTESGGDLAVLLEYWDGDSWETVTYLDYTELFSVTGPILATTPIPSDWVQSAVNGVTRFWLRCRRGAAGTPPTDTQIREVRALPEVAALPAGLNVELSGMEEAGLFTHIFRGTPTPRGFEWDDIGAQLGHWNRGLLFTQLQAGGSGRQLIAVGTRGYVRFPVGLSGKPAEEFYPAVNNSFASLMRFPADDRVSQNERAPTVIKGVRYVTLYGNDFDKDNDIVQVWIRWDNGDPVFIGRGRNLPVLLQVPTEQTSRGYQYQVTASLLDGVRDERSPKISDVVAGVYQIAGPPERK